MLSWSPFLHTLHRSVSMAASVLRSRMEMSSEFNMPPSDVVGVVSSEVDVLNTCDIGDVGSRDEATC